MNLGKRRKPGEHKHSFSGFWCTQMWGSDCPQPQLLSAAFKSSLPRDWVLKLWAKPKQNKLLLLSFLRERYPLQMFRAVYSGGKSTLCAHIFSAFLIAHPWIGPSSFATVSSNLLCLCVTLLPHSSKAWMTAAAFKFKINVISSSKTYFSQEAFSW